MSLQIFAQILALALRVTVVETLAHFLACLEERHDFFFHGDRRARARVTPLSRVALLH
jgi:hypothetical protein